MKKFISAALAASVFVASPASATVTFNAVAGTGFVGKGDVQLAFGWNNAVMQARHTSISFVVDSSASYDVTCEWTTETGGRNSKIIHHEVTNHKTVSSTAAVDSTSRKTGQYTGWFLNGYAGAFETIEVPQIGDSCPQGGSASDQDPPGNDAVVTDVSNVTGGTGTLSAVYDGDARVIYTF